MRCHADVVSLCHYRDSEELANASTVRNVALTNIHAARFEVGSTFLAGEQALSGLFMHSVTFQTSSRCLNRCLTYCYRDDCLLVKVLKLFKLSRQQGLFNEERFDRLQFPS